MINLGIVIAIVLIIAGVICFAMDTFEVHLYLIAIGIIALIVLFIPFICTRVTMVDYRVSYEATYEELMMEINNASEIDSDLLDSINTYNKEVKKGIAKANDWVFNGLHYEYYLELPVIELNLIDKPILREEKQDNENLEDIENHENTFIVEEKTE